MGTSFVLPLPLTASAPPAPRHPVPLPALPPAALPEGTVCTDPAPLPVAHVRTCDASALAYYADVARALPFGARYVQRLARDIVGEVLVEVKGLRLRDPAGTLHRATGPHAVAALPLSWLVTIAAAAIRRAWLAPAAAALVDVPTWVGRQLAAAGGMHLLVQAGTAHDAWGAPEARAVRDIRASLAASGFAGVTTSPHELEPFLLLAVRHAAHAVASA